MEKVFRPSGLDINLDFLYLLIVINYYSQYGQERYI